MYDRWIIGSRFSSGPYVVTTRPAATDAERRDALPPSLAAGVLERWAGGERQLLCEMHRSCSGGYEDFSSLTSRELVQALVWRIRAGELLVVPPVRPAVGAPLLRPEPDEPPAALPKAPPRSYQLRVRLMIDPRDARSRDDRFTLIGGALSSRAY